MTGCCVWRTAPKPDCPVSRRPHCSTGGGNKLIQSNHIQLGANRMAPVLKMSLSRLTYPSTFPTAPVRLRGHLHRVQVGRHAMRHLRGRGDGRCAIAISQPKRALPRSTVAVLLLVLGLISQPQNRPNNYKMVALSKHAAPSRHPRRASPRERCNTRLNLL